MGGGLMQLVAYGAQDIYLTGNPQITFFKVVYRRHTNFAVEPIELTFNGTVGASRKVTCTVARHGDLVHQMWLEMTIAAAAASSEGMSIIKSVEVEIGGQRIDKQYYRFMHGHARVFSSTDELVTLASMTRTSGTAATKVFVPLNFWFCNNPGLALPLVALQYHEVKINVEFHKQILFAAAVGSDTIAGADFNTASIWANYVYLDTDERRRFAQTSHEYLIEQVQDTVESLTASSGGNVAVASATEKTSNITMAFNHPVKYLLWYMGHAADTVTVAAANGLNSAQDIYLSNAKLQLNGHDRFAERPGEYFGNLVPYQCGLGNEKHNNASMIEFGTVTQDTNEGRINNLEGLDAALATAVGTTTSGVKYYMYSFALKPQEHQPSGTCNFSRIDNARLQLKCKSTSDGAASTSTLHLFAVNYNVLRVMSGMAGLAYSN